MSIKYGSIEPGARKPRQKSLINHNATAVSADDLSDEALKQFSKKRLLELAKQNRAPSVAKAAATELLERVEPKKERADAQMTATDAARIADIYERLFGKACPNCGHVEIVQ